MRSVWSACGGLLSLNVVRNYGDVITAQQSAMTPTASRLVATSLACDELPGKIISDGVPACTCQPRGRYLSASATNSAAWLAGPRRQRDCVAGTWPSNFQARRNPQESRSTLANPVIPRKMGGSQRALFRHFRRLGVNSDLNRKCTNGI